MDVVKDSFIDLERRRRQLEQNVSELQKLLRHWQTWEAEYEGFKEEIQSLSPDVPASKLQAEAATFEGYVLKGEEVTKLIRDDKGKPRRSEQIIGLLSRRIDYVQENVKAAQKRYDDAEAKLAAVNIVMQPEARDEEGLPLTEITEELDDDDNVLSSTLQTPGGTAPQIIEALRKNGMTDLPGDPQTGPKAIEAVSDFRENQTGEAISSEHQAEQVKNQSNPDSPKKQVSFAEATKSPADDESINAKGQNASKPPKTVHQDVVERLADDGFPSEPIVPEGETPEQAAIRREMLQYSMNDIGAIVAEINIEQGDVSDSELDSDENDERYDDDEEEEDDDDEEEEDRFGRTKVRVVGDDYRQQMFELERKLNVKSLVNAGPDMDEKSDDLEDSTVSRKARTTKKPSSRSRKNVKFAGNLDVQDAPDKPKERPVADTIVERSAPEPAGPVAATKPKKVSAFKAAKAKQADTSGPAKENRQVISNGPLAGMKDTQLFSAAQKKNRPFSSVPSVDVVPRTVPEGSPGRTLSDAIVERPMQGNQDSVEAPDEFDPNLMEREIAVKYHKMRDRMIPTIHPPPEEEEEPLGDPEGLRISKFKAARMGKKVK